MAEHLSRIGEDGLLRRLRPLLDRHTAGFPLGTGDDVAVTPPPPRGTRVVWTIDSMIEGTHFRFWPANSPYLLGRKLASSNLSDLASKGADGWLALVSLGVPATASVEDIESLYSGLDEVLTGAGVRLAGGDTVKAPQWSLTLSLAGLLPRKVAPAARHRARPGMNLFVTGWPGESAAGLALLESGDEDSVGRHPELVRRHLDPTARMPEGRELARGLRRLAMMDLSDGIAKDAQRLAAASTVQLIIEEARLPVSPALSAWAQETGRSALDMVVRGGEDYELLFAAPATLADVQRIFSEAGSTLPVWHIGRVEKGGGVVIHKTDGRMEQAVDASFEHFSEGGEP